MSCILFSMGLKSLIHTNMIVAVTHGFSLDDAMVGTTVCVRRRLNYCRTVKKSARRALIK